ncbi:hypothetical protein L1987_00898 [Smallanthus sonchifolius]|uniref:Uncharacterized protein n=1 Tax=Smallanthus sonchifolius TaxID=185202 RepID=A0ACB9K3R8_9ASTR|nr:hypothetical protein L1987_00898 [Smallanthus sonchifolius]
MTNQSIQIALLQTGLFHTLSSTKKGILLTKFAALVAAASYQAVMSPPDVFKHRYIQLMFIYANTLAWSSSITVIVMLTSSFPFQREIQLQAKDCFVYWLVVHEGGKDKRSFPLHEQQPIHEKEGLLPPPPSKTTRQIRPATNEVMKADSIVKAKELGWIRGGIRLIGVPIE